MFEVAELVQKAGLALVSARGSLGQQGFRAAPPRTGSHGQALAHMLLTVLNALSMLVCLFLSTAVFQYS